MVVSIVCPSNNIGHPSIIVEKIRNFLNCGSKDGTGTKVQCHLKQRNCQHQSMPSDLVHLAHGIWIKMAAAFATFIVTSGTLKTV